jgi:hypothetical protein
MPCVSGFTGRTRLGRVVEGVRVVVLGGGREGQVMQGPFVRGWQMDPLVGIRHRHRQGRSESACFNTRCMYETELSLMMVGVSTQDIWSP